MSKIVSITLSTNPTIVIADTYLKAGASITVNLEDGDEYADVMVHAQELLSAAYHHALLSEVKCATSAQKKRTMRSLVRFLERSTGYGEEA